MLKSIKTLLAISLFFFANIALADVAPTEYIKENIAIVKKEVESYKSEDKSGLDKILEEKISPLFDFKTMSRSCLGANWKKANDQQQKEFVELFSSLLSKTYLARIRDNIAGSEIKYVAERIKGKKAIVRTKVAEPGNDYIAIDYRLKLSDGKWRAYDVIIENVGLVSNYRSEFAGIIRKSGVQGVIDKLKEKEK